LKYILKEKTPREGHQVGIFLAEQLGSPGTCNPEEAGLPRLAVSSSSTLFSRSGAVGLPPVLRNEKTIKSRHFLSDTEVITAVEI
jgi:hypothetical protein